MWARRTGAAVNAGVCVSRKKRMLSALAVFWVHGGQIKRKAALFPTLD